MRSATRPQYHRLQRILMLIREGTRAGSLPNCLLFAREVATYIRERVWHPSQQMRQRRDGTLELRLETSSRKELPRWILSWMPYVRVLAPRQLRERVCQRLRQGLLQ